MSEAPATIRVRLLRPGARLPTRATEHSTGFDLYACLDAPVEIANLPVVVPTGLAMEGLPGTDIQIRPRSGLARQGVLSTFGTLDADYRGELFVTMYTVSPSIRHTVQHGDRIAQLVVARHLPAEFEEAAELSETARGSGGHGSTGR